MNASTVIDSSQIRERAYARWQRRGCPDGAPEVDWLEAEQELFDEQWDVQASSAPVVAPTAPVVAQRPKTTRKLAARTARIASVVAAAEASAEAAAPASAPRSVRRRAAAASR